jgi:hypothetical protein
MKSLDLSFFALIKRAKRRDGGYNPKNKLRKNKTGLINIAIVKPRPGKGFEFEGEIFPKMADLAPVLKSKGFGAYRQGWDRFKANGAVNPTVALAA